MNQEEIIKQAIKEALNDYEINARTAKNIFDAVKALRNAKNFIASAASDATLDTYIMGKLKTAFFNIESTIQDLDKIRYED